MNTSTNTPMTWQELVAKQTKEFSDQLGEYKKNFDRLQMDKQNLLQASKSSNVGPDYFEDKMNREYEGFKKEWGLYGDLDKILYVKQKKEVFTFLTRQMEVEKLQERQSMNPVKEKTR